MNEQPTSNQQNLSQEIYTPEQLKELETSIENKKRRFKLLVTVVVSGVGVLFVLSIFGFIYTNFLKERKAGFAVNNAPKIENKPIEVEEKNEFYTNGILKLSLEYPSEAKVTEDLDMTKFDKGEPAKVEINAINQTGTSGYVFKIKRFKATSRSIDEVATVKKESLAVSCPSTSEISPISKVIVDTIDARSFEVRNCNGDFTYTFVPRFYSYYELEQMYKGDLGVKQQNKSKTIDILSSLKFFPETDDNPLPDDPYQTYKNSKLNFQFRHPKYDDSCCEIAGPSAEKFNTLIVLADKVTVKSKTQFDGFGLFTVNYDKSEKFGDFLTKQKQLLRDDYVVVKGTEPKVTEKEIDVGNKKGTLLSGYSWKGNDLIYIDMGDKALVISVLNTSGGQFQKAIDEILTTFVFY